MSVLGLGLFTAGCGQGNGPPASLLSTESLAEASGLSPEDEIDGLDLAVGSDGALHLVWREQMGLYGEPGGERIVYRRADGDPLRWSRPIVVAGNHSGQPQIAVRGEDVHVLTAPGLRHWLLSRGSEAFTDLGEMLPDEISAATHDAITIGDRVVVVFLANRQSDQPGAYAVSWTAAGVTAPTMIPGGPAQSGAARSRPELYRVDDRLMAAWMQNSFTVTYDERARATVHTSSASVRVAWSEDAGLSWGRPSEVMRTRADAVAAGGTADGPLVFIAAHGLYGSRRINGTWTNVRIAAYKTGFFSGSAATTAVAAALCGGHTTVFWADARHRRSDRRWWNPLGGFPWSDQPDWYNNDLFMATFIDLDDDVAAIDPVRLTSGPSLTTEIAVARRNDALLVFRVGRTSVRKSPRDAGAPPVILQYSVPCR